MCDLALRLPQAPLGSTRSTAPATAASLLLRGSQPASVNAEPAVGAHPRITQTMLEAELARTPALNPDTELDGFEEELRRDLRKLPGFPALTWDAEESYKDVLYGLKGKPHGVESLPADMRALAAEQGRWPDSQVPHKIGGTGKLDWLEAALRGVVRFGQAEAEDLCSGWVMRVLHGRSEADFTCLSRRPHRRIVFASGSDALVASLGSPGYDLLMAAGYSHVRVEQLLARGESFRLAVFPASALAPPIRAGDWQGLLSLVREVYPDVATKVESQTKSLRDTTLEAIEREAGFDFQDIDTRGPSDPRFMTYERLVGAEGTLAEVRAFLFHTVRAGQIYDSEAFTSMAKRLPRHVARNCPLEEIGHCHVVPLVVCLPGCAMRE